MERPRDSAFYDAFLRPDPHPAAERLGDVFRLERRGGSKDCAEEGALARSRRFARESIGQLGDAFQGHPWTILCAFDPGHEKRKGFRQFACGACAGDDDLGVETRGGAYDVEQERPADADRPPVAHGQDASRSDPRGDRESRVVVVRRDGGEGLGDRLFLADSRAAGARQVQTSSQTLHDALRASIAGRSIASASRPC